MGWDYFPWPLKDDLIEVYKIMKHRKIEWSVFFPGQSSPDLEEISSRREGKDLKQTGGEGHFLHAEGGVFGETVEVGTVGRFKTSLESLTDSKGLGQWPNAGK